MTSRTPRQFAVLGFLSTHDALDAEALLLDMGIEVVPIPAPRSIGALCGVALRMPPEQAERANKYLERAGIKLAGVASIEDV